MIGRTGVGWQTTTADLALILFLVVAAAGVTGDPQREADVGLQGASVDASPAAGIYRETAAVSLSEWLRGQAPDERQVATVIVRRANGDGRGAMDRGLLLLDEIQATGLTGRMLIESGSSDETFVMLTYDRLAGSGTPLAAR